MHELSIAESIVTIIRQHVQEQELPLVQQVTVAVGALAGVVPDSLEFSYTAITAGSVLEHSRLNIKNIPFTIRCKQCGTTSEQNTGIVLCPRCSSAETTTLTGNELHVMEIELDESEVAS